MSEDTPLLASLSPYDRFSPRAKRLHIDVVAFTAVLPRMCLPLAFMQTAAHARLPTFL